MDPFPLRRADRVIGRGNDVARHPITAMTFAPMGALPGGRVRFGRSVLALLTTLAFMAVYLPIRTPPVLSVTTY